jgi:hypothetical protein
MSCSSARLSSLAACVNGLFLVSAAAAQASDPVPPAWLSQVSEEIRRAEYGFSALEDGVWSAPNRAQGLRSRVDRGGLAVSPRAAEPGAEGTGFALLLRTASFGRGDELVELACRSLVARENRVELDHGLLVEWLVNDERGIEQGWTIERAPSGDPGEPLRVVLEVAGDLVPRIEPGGRSAVFGDAEGMPRLRYGGLVAHDASGRELDAALVPAMHGLDVRVDDAGALYPITVDPVLSGPAWIVESDQAGAYLGYSVATAGDVNGDGYSDVIVGASSFEQTEVREGAAFVYLGSPGGLSTSASWSAFGGGFNALFGWTVSTAGDVNADGFDDVIVGAVGFSNGQSFEGAAFLYLGSPAGLETNASWTAEGDQAFADFGFSVASAGDVDGDGDCEVIVGAPELDSGQNGEGRAHVYLGSAAGLATSPAWIAEGDVVDAGFGTAVAGAGDVNGDGFSDAVVGAPGFAGPTNEGSLFVYHGSPTGLSASADWSVQGAQSGALLGSSVAAAGDVNGDGYSDVLAGAPNHAQGEDAEGAAFVYLGSSAGLSTSPDWAVEGNQEGALFGSAVAPAGDVNADGYSDVLVGAHGFANGEFDEGAAFAYLGSAGGLASSASWTQEGGQVGASFGNAVAGAGDVDGNGYSDVLVGARFFDNGEEEEGRAYAYLGSADGLATEEAWETEGGQANAQFGGSVATAGDVNGDGYWDVLVGAAEFDGGLTNEGKAFLYLGSATGPSASPAWNAEGEQAFARFGSSVASAGDVNGDGYSDVVVGARQYTNGQSAEGRAFLYLGSVGGLSASAVWTAEGNQRSAELGYSVASAGDVNGDGYIDVVVGARGFDNEGRAYVHAGSATGLATAALWTGASNQIGSLFGGSVASAGDVNGDGFSDVIVGAELWDDGEQDEGGAFVFHGSPAGPSASPDWSADSDDPNSRFGISVASAGDVNGDGFSDAVVGAYYYSNGQPSEGAAFVFHGSASGLSTLADRLLESNQANASFGYSVASAGDVDGDAYSDVIVGAWSSSGLPNFEGAAFVYHGSPSGLPASAAWSVSLAQSLARFGFSVAGAGDVNGDGHSDVIIGAPTFDDDLTDAGAAFLYLGNDGSGGRIRAPQQRRADGSAPIALLGRSDARDLFTIHVEAPVLSLGWAVPRPTARLEWEVKPLGVPLDGTDMETSAPVVFDPFGGPLVFDELAERATLANRPHHWRARVVFEGNPLVTSTPWFSQPGNAVSEAKLRFPKTKIRRP